MGTDEPVDAFTAPKDYEDLYRTYFDYACSVVRRQGITDASSEDVASEILLKFWQRDFLPKYDPTLVFNYHGQPRKAQFRTFLTKFIESYVRGHRDRQKYLQSHEALIFDMPLGTEDDTTWGAAFNAVDDHAETVIFAADEAELIRQSREYLATVPRRSHFDMCDLVALFDAIVDQVVNDGKISMLKLRQHFGVGPTAMHTWMWWLRENLAPFWDRPLPARKRKPTVTTDTVDDEDEG